MQSSSSQHKELIPSLVGIGLLADILPDLPLPTHLPSVLEQMVLGQRSMPSEDMRLLDNTNPVLCAQINNALASVDTKFLKLKSPTARMDCSSPSCPPMVRAAFKNRSPKLLLKKIDTSVMSDDQVPRDHVMTPLSAGDLQDASLYTPERQRKPSKSKSSRLSHDGVTPLSVARKRKRSSSSSSTGKPAKRRRSLVVSIDRRKLEPSLTSAATKRRRRIVSSSSSSSTEDHSKLIVSIPRLKLHRVKHRTQPDHHPPSQYSPYGHPLAPHGHSLTPHGHSLTPHGHSLAPHGHSLHSHPPQGHPSTPYGHPPYSHQLPPYGHPYQGHSPYPPQGHLPQDHFRHHSTAVPYDNRLAVAAPNPSDHNAVKKKHKKHRHHLKQESPYAHHVHRFRKIIGELLDHTDQSAPDALLPRSTLAHLTDETCRMKQLAILHHIPVDFLTQLLSLMDRHVLDSAELLMNEETSDAEPREIARERILRSLDASLIILHITTAPQMPVAVQLEESIDQVISHASYHLDHNIYPAFDPVYRGETKDSKVLPRQKRRYAGQSSSYKSSLPVYNRLIEVLNNLALLLETNPLTDNTVLKLSTLGTLPFFVENVSSLQLSALNLVRAIFSRYEKHRDLILEDIFASLARLPTSKRNLRSFRLSNGKFIQMLTALVLQLVQCMLVVPKHITSPGSTADERDQQEPDLIMIQSYDLAVRTGQNFLSTFMKKCCGGREEEDFRSLFDNFIQDLLSTLGLPEWPASETLLTLLGMLLVRTFSNKTTEQHLKTTALEHLGVVAARLRKDAISSTQEEHNQLIDILAEVLQNKLDSRSPLPSPTATRMDAFSENCRHLQKVLIAYLTRQSDSDPSSAYARDYYVGQWLRDNHLELEKTLQGHSTTSDPLLMGDYDSDGPAHTMQQAEENKDFLISLLKPIAPSDVNQLASVLDERKAALVTRYLSSSRALSKSFDHYLQQLLRVLNESAVHVRTRAMKALSTIVSADPSILSRSEVHRAVYSRFQDHSTLVREAAVELVGSFVKVRPELTAQYYEMLLERILDTGISVRKRVIRILKDVCTTQPDFPKVNEIYLKMIRRINDEEGIKQLVTSVFAQLWFALPPVESRQDTIMKRVTTITDMIAMSSENAWFEELLKQLLKGEEKTTVLSVCQVMVDSIKERIINLDESSGHSSSSFSSKQLVSCFATLDLFCKIKPSLLLPHATTLHPYLSSQCSNADEIQVLHYVACVLEATIPLMDHPSREFLASVEEDLIRLILKQGQSVVQSCISCLSVVVNQVTHNFTLIKESFQRFFVLLKNVQIQLNVNPKDPQLSQRKRSVIRSVFTVGLFCKHFDMNSITQEAQGQSISNQVYSLLIYFGNSKDPDIKMKSILGLGLLCIRYPEMMLEKEAKELYLTSLSSSAPASMKYQVMKNLYSYLQEVERTMQQANTERGQQFTEVKESLVELGDRHSSVTSTIAQIFLVHVADAYYNVETQIRKVALEVITLILRQGLVHPGQCVSYLIAISTDPEQPIKVKADELLTEHNSRFGSFLQTQIVVGLKKAHQIQTLLVPDSARGCADAVGGQVSLLARLYTLVRSSKPQRRAFLKIFLRHFEDYEKNSLSMLLFLADNLAYFSYTVLEEPLFILHYIDMTISVTGSNLLQAFRDALGRGAPTPNEEEEEDTVERLSQKSCDLQQLNFCCRSCQGCILLLVLKQHLKKSFALTDQKCQKYSPNESVKAFDKAIVKKQWHKFEPVTVLQEVKKEMLEYRASMSKEDCIQQYLEFKKLMNMLDPFEGEDDDSDQENAPPVHLPSTDTTRHTPVPQQQLLPPPVVVEEAAVAPRSRQRRSRSRASSTSSNISTSSRKKKRKGSDSSDKPTRKKRPRAQIIDDDSDDSADDPLFTS